VFGLTPSSINPARSTEPARYRITALGSALAPTRNCAPRLSRRASGNSAPASASEYFCRPTECRRRADFSHQLVSTKARRNARKKRGFATVKKANSVRGPTPRADPETVLEALEDTEDCQSLRKNPWRCGLMRSIPDRTNMGIKCRWR
jgi:hypothetical protein